MSHSEGHATSIQHRMPLWHRHARTQRWSVGDRPRNAEFLIIYMLFVIQNFNFKLKINLIRFIILILDIITNIITIRKIFMKGSALEHW